MRTYDFSPCGVRPSVSTAFSTSLKPPSGRARTTIPPITSNGWTTTAIRFPWPSPASRRRIAVTAEQKSLTVEGRKSDKAERDYPYRGISARPFKRQFNLADMFR